MVPSIKLSSGHQMPVVGFGIWKVPRESCAEQVYQAIKLGYRHIDGAWDYTNSKEAGEGVRKAIDEGIIKREDIFITSKLWNNYHKREHALEMARLENEAWGLGYLDLFLIHFPIALEFIPFDEIRFPCFWSDKEQTKVTPLAKVPISETWAAMEELATQKDSFVRSIGVSNFHTQLLYDLLNYCKIQPAVLQIEHHPYLTQPNLIHMAQENGITVTGYSTFGPQSFIELGNNVAKGTKPLFEADVVKKIADKHSKTPSQVLLRFCTQRNIIVIPKSNNVERLKQNLESVEFDLSKEELEEIASLNQNLRFNDPSTLGRAIRIFT